MELLEERAREINAGKEFNNLIIFGEGTTTNGRGIASFKKGAFVID